MQVNQDKTENLVRREADPLSSPSLALANPRGIYCKLPGNCRVKHYKYVKMTSLAWDFRIFRYWSPQNPAGAPPNIPGMIQCIEKTLPAQRA